MFDKYEYSGKTSSPFTSKQFNLAFFTLFNFTIILPHSGFNL